MDGAVCAGILAGSVVNGAFGLRDTRKKRGLDVGSRDSPVSPAASPPPAGQCAVLPMRRMLPCLSSFFCPLRRICLAFSAAMSVKELREAKPAARGGSDRRRATAVWGGGNARPACH